MFDFFSFIADFIGRIVHFLGIIGDYISSLFSIVINSNGLFFSVATLGPGFLTAGITMIMFILIMSFVIKLIVQLFL